MKILLADAEPIESRRLARTLRDLDHRVLLARDGLEALGRLEREPDVRLVIADLRLPDLGGAELCRLVRGRPDPLYTYMILLDEEPCRRRRIEALRAGADDSLHRPVDRGELAARLDIGRRILAMQAELIRRSAELESLHRELESRNHRLADLALTDPLTGLRNRRHFHDLFDAHFTAAARHEAALTIILLDVDHFKRFNDTLGHPAGDVALATVASILRQNVRDRDLVARYGGEEFVVLLPGGDPAEGRRMAERLRARIARHPWPDLPVTASFGVATMGRSTPIPSLLLDQADRALYASKHTGRNRVTHFADLACDGSGRPGARRPRRPSGSDPAVRDRPA